MKVLIAPGAFKNSLSAKQVADCIAAGLANSGLAADLIRLPVADGGNGTLDAFLAQGGTRHSQQVLDPLGRDIEAEFGLLQDGETAIIEMALASGLELLKPDEYDPLRATTYGTGQLMQAALDAGAKTIIVGMGGSATVDAGMGCVQALGVQMYDTDDRLLTNDARSLPDVARIDMDGMDPRWQSTRVIIASDVDNPTLGEMGAAAVFGPQKGATPADVVTLEKNLCDYFAVVKQATGIDVSTASGGGAAGALSAGLIAFVGGQIESGIDLILRHAGFEAHLANADLVVTGEGRIDEQTIYGKGPIGVARVAAQKNVLTVAIVGGLDAPDRVFHEAGIQAVLPIPTGPMPLKQALENAAELVTRAAERLGYLLQI